MGFVVSVPEIPADGNWHYICGRWDGDSMRTYIDGVLIEG